MSNVGAALMALLSSYPGHSSTGSLQQRRSDRLTTPQSRAFEHNEHNTNKDLWQQVNVPAGRQEHF